MLLNWDDRGVEVLIRPESEEHLYGAHTGWLKGLQITADGTGIASHAGVTLVRALADNIGLTAGLPEALASRRLLVHDRGRVLADLACAIADGAEVISDFGVIATRRSCSDWSRPCPPRGGRWRRSLRRGPGEARSARR